MPNPPSAAQALYPNLPTGTPAEVDHRRKPNTADALFPAWSREAKQRSRDQQLWNEICKRQRDNFLRGWREQRGEGKR